MPNVIEAGCTAMPDTEAPAKHTPGPWRVEPNANCDVQTADGQFEIATTHPEVLRGGECDSTAARANAVLIATALAGLAALEQLLAQMEPNGMMRLSDGALMAEEAIAKARGE